MRRTVLLLLALAVPLTLCAELPPLIPREVFFKPPSKAWPKVSPDGKQLAFIAAGEGGEPNIWIQPTAGGEAKPLTHERRPVWDYEWTGDSKHVLYGQDDGDENTHVFSADLTTGNIRDLTPFRGVRTQKYYVDPKQPDQMLVEMNLRDRRVFDVHRVNLETGAITLEAKNPGDVNSWVTDQNFVVRAATALDAKTGRAIIRVRDSADAPWRDLLVMPFERTPFMGQIAGGSLIAGFAPDGKSLYVASALHSDTARIERIDLRTGETLEVVAEHPKADPGDFAPEVLRDPKTGAIQAVRFVYQTSEWKFLDPKIKEDIEAITKQTARFNFPLSRSADDMQWIVAAFSSSAPPAYYTYDRATKKLAPFYDEGETLKGYTLAEKKPVLIKARDGMELVSYLTLPAGSSGRKLPFIILPHGGPWTRDWDNFDPEAQFLANRGFAVLQVNYRGSTALGIKYYNAGNGQVGTGMIDDLVDATRWAVAQGIADPKKLVSYGGSMGAYATLRLLTREPEMFAGGVATFGVSELKTAVEAFPPYWVAARNRWIRRMGDVIHDEALNRRLSPLYDVDKIQRPLLLVGGGRDVRARLEHIERLVKTLRDAKRDVTFVVYPDEGHGLARHDNQMDMAGRTEEFLARLVGTRAEPWKSTKDPRQRCGSRDRDVV